jgi:hypothetical protein
MKRCCWAAMGTACSARDSQHLLRSVDRDSQCVRFSTLVYLPSVYKGLVGGCPEPPRPCLAVCVGSVLAKSTGMNER